ncbi:MobB family relaxase [Robiginitalea sp. M366]|uniref:MobB family relaxase n=1 Tax=Robiginitalea aestuariiviva TaxID=3036903 RepID=UPI00240CE5F9|nr:MobB family relaxase [Robiginitalea aestuariiviva]MDG1573295.1 MobB family relaxase [Robiginitalea aestuariiviva]
MYITITPQRSGGHFARSVADYVSYLEKEAEGISDWTGEQFFSRMEDQVSPEKVICEIDGNATKLSRNEPRFYAITISPSASELKSLGNTSEDLKAYTREIMASYAQCFNREIDGRVIRASDILYFARIEHQRFYKGTDRAVQMNQAVAAQILELKHEVRRIERGEQPGKVGALQKEILRLEASAPAQLEGRRIREGMPKPGPQSHIHIIVSRKDASNRVSLSPGSKYKASTVEFGGKLVKRGFDRDRFFTQAERIFDTRFNYQRSFTQHYANRRLLKRDPERFFKALAGLPGGERGAALKVLIQAGVKLPMVSGPGFSITVKAAKALRRSVSRALSASTIQF